MTKEGVNSAFNSVQAALLAEQAKPKSYIMTNIYTRRWECYPTPEEALNAIEEELDLGDDEESEDVEGRLEYYKVYEATKLPLEFKTTRVTVQFKKPEVQ